MTAPDMVIGGRYRLVSRLANGGMGTVWRGWDEVLQRPVAVKQLLHQPGLSRADAQVAADRAMREARITARLHHPNAVPVYDVVEQDGRPCLIMQYVPSRSLQQVLNEQRMLRPPVVAGIGAELAAALAAAHQAGIVHRDVKPSNVLITEDGTAKLTDFGVSHAIGDVNLTSTGIVTGTPAFLAPEVARGAESDAAADVFSLGSTLYAALEGRPPFGTAENPMALLHRVASGQTIPPRRSGPMAPLLTRMLAADPAARPRMLDVSNTLAALRTDLGASAGATAVAAAVPDPTRSIPPAPEPVPVTQRTTALPVIEPAGTRVPPSGPAAPGLAGPGPDEPPGRSGRIGMIAVAAALVLLAAVLGGFWLINQDGNGPATGPGRTSQPPASKAATSRPASSKPASSSPAPSNPPSSTAATSPSSKPSSNPTTSPPPSTSASQPSSSAPSSQTGTPTASQLSQAITDYYGLLPANTDTAWNRLTTSYQNGTAQNRQTYQSFWDSVASVEVSDASGTPPGGVVATLLYDYKDGRVVQERTAFQLVRSDGILKIDSSSVLNSQTQ